MRVKEPYDGFELEEGLPGSVKEIDIVLENCGDDDIWVEMGGIGLKVFSTLALKNYYCN